MRPSNLASRLIEIANASIPQYNDGSSVETGFESWCLKFAPLAGEVSGRSKSDADPDGIAALHYFFTHEAVKFLKFLSRNQCWFYTLVAESVRQNPTLKTADRITRANIMDALVVLQQTVKKGRGRVLHQAGTTIVNPIFSGDATHPGALEGLNFLAMV